MSALSWEDRDFKRAVIISVSAHLALFILILVSPYFPKPGHKGMIHYVNVMTFPGRGGGGGQSTEPVETELPARESLRDLTTPQKLEQQKPPSLTHPVEKPKRGRTQNKPKKTSIQKRQQSSAKSSGQENSQTGSGSGLRVGIGVGAGGGFGFGSEYSSQIGLSSFPFSYYLQTLQDRISSSWYTSQIRTGITGKLVTTVMFKIFRKGNISEPEILETSGNRTMDLSARRAIRNAADFPPLPREYQDDYLIIRLIFEHNR